jgi:acetolactate synthase I/II/III large subunit
MSRSGAQILVDQLVAHSVDLAFCIPGESYIGVLDALRDAPIRLVVARHEAGAANMAEAYGKLTGRPGVCFVTRAPGATHAAVGVHTAYQDSTPLVLFVGQVPTGHLGREAFQEVDYSWLFGQMAKWVALAERPDELPALVTQAFHVAGSGRPGPVVIALPEDVQSEVADVPDADPISPQRRTPSRDELGQVRELLGRAERPLVIVGGGGWSEQAGRDVLEFAERNNLPVAASFRRQDYVDNRSPHYAGVLTIGMNPSLAHRLQEADLLIVLGSRLGEIATRGWTLVEPPRPRQTLVHVHADPAELGRVFEAALPIHADSPAAAEGLLELEPVDGTRWSCWTRAARDEHLAFAVPTPVPGGVNLGEVLIHLRERLPDDAVLTNGAGNYTVWCHRFFEFRRNGTQLAPCSGSMGYGIPAAVAARAVHPERIAVCVSGDGDFLMSGHELAAAMQERLPIIVLVVNNRMYGTIRMHQERNFPGRVSGTDLLNPDFVALGKAFGAYAERIVQTDEFPDALERALGAGRSALLELVVDPEAITPTQTLSEIRAGYVPRF